MFLFSILYLSSKTLQIRGAVISLVLSAQKHCGSPVIEALINFVDPELWFRIQQEWKEQIN